MTDLFNYEPVLPYNGSSGHSGTDTSKERADQQDKTGKTKNMQLTTLELLRQRTFIGITWHELARELNIHHGTASGVLSNLHKGGLIVRLAMRRGRSKIYVLPEWIEYRAIDEIRVKTHECPNCGIEF